MDLHSVPSLRAIIFLQFHQKLWQRHECSLLAPARKCIAIVHWCCMLHVPYTHPVSKLCSSRSAVFHSHLLHVAWIPHRLKCFDVRIATGRGDTGEGIALQLNSRLAFVLVITLVHFFYRSYKAIPIPTKNFPTFFLLQCIVTGQAERNWTRKKGQELRRTA